MRRLFSASLFYLALLPLALAQSIPFPGPGAASSAPIGTPQSLGTSNASVGIVSTTTLVTTANILSGDLAVVCVNMNTNNSVTAASVSDGTNTYTKAIGSGIYGVVTETTLWYKANASAVGSGATITVTLSAPTTGATNGFAVGAGRVTGVIAVPIDKTAAGTAGAGTSATTTTAALSQANEIGWGCGGMIAASGTYGSATGFTNLNHTENLTSNTFAALDYKVVAATTALTFTPTWTVAGSRAAATIGTFKGN